MAELVVHADALDGHGALLCQAGADRLAQTADDGVLLHGDDLAAVLGGGEHQLLVQRLDGAHIDDPGMDALGLQRFACLNGLVDHQAGGDDGHIGAVLQHLALADLELVVLAVEHGAGEAGEAHIDRADILGGGADSGLGLDVIRGAHDHHAGDGAHDGEILVALVAGTILAHGDAAVSGADLHVQMGIAHGVADLLKGASGGEHGEGGGKGHKAHGAQTGGHAHHIRLSDAAVNVALGEGLLENAGFGGAGQVGIQHDQIGHLFAQLSQSIAIAFAGGDLLHVSHLTSPPVLPGERAAPPWRSHTAPRWGRCRASRPDSP